MRKEEEEMIALEKGSPNHENNRDDQDVDDEIEPPFKISKKGLDKLMQNYLSRTLDEDLVNLDKIGGMHWLEGALQTDLKNGIKDDDLFLARKKAFDSNEQEPEEPLSKYNKILLDFCNFVLEALEDRIIQILIVAAIISIVVEMIQGHNRSLGN